ncbi:MAG: aconitate hydratase [Deltaproteobacteria bacterium]|nr:aconitate hydratase [Deltaproteobacteria bacterium]
MGKTLTEKIIESHLVSGSFAPGAEIGIQIDQTLTQDATGTMAYLQFESMGIPEVKTELSVSYIDHNTIQTGFENADDHRYLQDVARRYGIILSRAGNGICHQVHLERFGRPGRTLIGSDSHTPMGGALAMMAIGAGGLDVALAMAGEPFYLTVPRVVGINLAGKLRPWVSAKDVILKVLQIFTTKGNVDCVFEYGGAGTATLTVPERATIANMGAECGVTTSVFPSDAMTRRFLRAQRREEDWCELSADRDARYERVVQIDLGRLEPMTAMPHSPDHVATVREADPVEVQQVCIGSCTNSSYKDLATVAAILRGRVAHPSVSFIVSPGSRQVLMNLARDGYLADLLASGARLMENACGFCIGSSQSPPSGGISLRTSNRNFYGRSGTQDAGVYLVSPEVAAAAVLTGKLRDPRTLGLPYPRIKMPAHLHIDDSLFIKPDEATLLPTEEIRRGPNIGAPPHNDSLPERISGEVTIRVGDKVTTDHIIPAGERMKYRSNIPIYAEFVFEHLDKQFALRAKQIRDEGRHNIIVAGLSYGQGSSREHAAICPMYLGVKAVIALSFERIHAANLINFGILPLVFQDGNDYSRIDRGDWVVIDAVVSHIRTGKPITVKNITKGTAFITTCELTERQKDMVIAGGALNLRRFSDSAS